MLPYPQFEAQTRAEWRAWLRKHHRSARGVWLVTWKAGSGRPKLANGDAVEEALCFGWIDSLPRTLDDTRSMLLMTPRKAGSSWSKANRDRVERLSAAGLMTETGLAKAEAARQDGSWERLAAVERLTVPSDLARALRAVPRAKANFEAFPPSSKRIILEWILTAKRAETRAARVAETVELAERNLRAHHYRQPKAST